MICGSAAPLLPVTADVARFVHSGGTATVIERESSVTWTAPSTTELAGVNTSAVTAPSASYVAGASGVPSGNVTGTVTGTAASGGVGTIVVTIVVVVTVGGSAV